MDYNLSNIAGRCHVMPDVLLDFLSGDEYIIFSIIYSSEKYCANSDIIECSQNILKKRAQMGRPKVRICLEALQQLNILNISINTNKSFLCTINWEEICAINSFANQLSYDGIRALRNACENFEGSVKFSVLPNDKLEEILHDYSISKSENDQIDMGGSRWTQVGLGGPRWAQVDPPKASEVGTGRPTWAYIDPPNNVQVGLGGPTFGQITEPNASDEHKIRQNNSIDSNITIVTPFVTSNKDKDEKERSKEKEEKEIYKEKEYIIPSRDKDKEKLNNFITERSEVVKLQQGEINERSEFISPQRKKEKEGYGNRGLRGEEAKEGKTPEPVLQIDEAEQTDERKLSDEFEFSEIATESTTSESEMRTSRRLNKIDWKETRDLSLECYDEREINLIIENSQFYSSDEEKLIRLVWNDIAPLPEELEKEQELELETNEQEQSCLIPVDVFNRALYSAWEELKEQDINFQLNEQQAKDIFGFDVVRVDNEFAYKLVSSKIRKLPKDNDQDDEDSKTSRRNKKKRRTHARGAEGRRAIALMLESIEELSQDINNLTAAEMTVHLIIQQANKDSWVSESGYIHKPNEELSDYSQDQLVNEWSEQTGLPVDKTKALLKKLPHKGNRTILSPFHLFAEDIIELNEEMNEDSDVERLWAKKMAEKER